MSDLHSGQLPKVLRWLGAVALLASGVSFMLEGWEHLNSVEKFSAFFGFSIVLWLGGWISRNKFSDETGARVFFGVAAACATVNFVQLGAFIYSAVTGQPVVLPEVLMLQAPEQKTLVFLATLTVAGSFPIVWSGFRALAPHPASEVLAAQYFLLNTLFLIPTREPHHMAWLIMGAFIVLAWSLWRAVGAPLLTLLLAAVPLAVLIGRSLFYPTDSLFLAVLCFMSTGLLFVGAPKYLERREHVMFFQGLSIIPLAMGWYNVAMAYSGIKALDAMLLMSASLVVLSFLCVGESLGYRVLGSIVGLLAFVPAFFNGFTTKSIVLSLLVSMGFIVLGYARKEKFPLLAGAAGFVWFLIHHLWHAVRLWHLNLWFILGLIGVMILIGATVAEKRKFTGRN